MFNELSNINKRKKEIENRLSQIVAPKEKQDIKIYLKQNEINLIDNL